MWLISAECPELIDAIPLLICDEETDGDVVKVESIGDDFADMGRYGLKSMLRPESKPYSIQREEALIEVERKIVGTTGPATQDVAVQVANAQFMTDLRMTTQRKQGQLRRPGRWQRNTRG